MHNQDTIISPSTYYLLFEPLSELIGSFLGQKRPADQPHSQVDLQILIPPFWYAGSYPDHKRHGSQLHLQVYLQIDISLFGHASSCPGHNLSNGQLCS